jgi:hypothetical protein
LQVRGYPHRRTVRLIIRRDHPSPQP